MKPDLRRLTLAALLSVSVVSSARAQVGHDPAHSPYRTLRYGQFIGLNAGYFRGDGGQIGVAPHNGATVGLRYDFLGSGTISVGLAGSYARLERFIVDKNKPIETGKTGPFTQNTTLLEGILQFNLTGGKTWHGLAPYVSAGIGLALAAKLPADTSGFKFRTKGALTPALGARVFITPRLFLRLEARSTFWQVSYPGVYRVPPTSDPSKPPVVSGPGKEWVTSGWYTIGLSYAFHRPF
ncbi:MAG TPA: outer membrane beta-barrel protein [Gemmatimonadales bacterium]|nr:outer membrane beta-barrel protein [Gemmatimonadales bacterium]